MSLVPCLLSITARGGLKIGFTLLAISLFTGLVVAVQSISYSYASEASILKEISRSPKLTVNYEPRTQNAVKVEVATVKRNGYIAIMMASKNLEQLLILHSSKVEGEYPRNGEIVVGGRLKPLLQGSKLNIEGQLLNVSGFIPVSVHLSSAILLTPETMRALGIKTTTLYYEEATEGSEISLAEAPSSASLVQAVTKEALHSLTLTTLLFYGLLAITCMIQGYNMTHEGRRVLKVFSALGTPGWRMAASLGMLAVAMSGVGLAFGYALGIIASAFASSFMSITLGLPYIKPIASLYLIYWLGSAFTISSIALAAGLMRGYSNVYGS